MKRTALLTGMVVGVCGWLAACEDGVPTSNSSQVESAQSAVRTPRAAADAPRADEAEADEAELVDEPAVDEPAVDEPAVDELAEHLRYLREEEKLAHDVYVTMGEQWGTRVFANIARSEQRHMNAVAAALTRHAIEDPVGDADIGVFTNPTLGELYKDLVADGRNSEVAALRVGATIEDLDIFDLMRMSEATDAEDLLLMYGNLMRASRNHLRVFTSLLDARGASYDPQYISQADYDAIVGSDWERGGRNGGGGRCGGQACNGQGCDGQGCNGQGCSGRGNGGEGCNRQGCNGGGNGAQGCGGGRGAGAQGCDGQGCNSQGCGGRSDGARACDGQGCNGRGDRGQGNRRRGH